MSARIRHHIRSNVVGYVALFLFAMGGTAWAVDGPLPGQNQVGSEDIINDEVKAADLGTGEVKSGDIGDFEVKADDIAPDSLGGNKIADRSVKNADLGLGASSSNTIADGGIQSIDVANDTLSGADIAEASLRIPENSINPPGGEPASTACDQISEVGSFSVSPDFTEIGEPTPAKLWVCVRLSGIVGDGSEWQSVTLG